MTAIIVFLVAFVVMYALLDVWSKHANRRRKL